MQPCLPAPPNVLLLGLSQLVTWWPIRAQGCRSGSLELAWLVSLFPQPQPGTCWPLSLSHRGWLTGTLPEDCAAHELEEALGVEAGPVDGDSVLGKQVRGGEVTHAPAAGQLTVTEVTRARTHTHRPLAS